MGSSSADRLYVLMKQGFPLPTFSEDDVLNHMVAEAVILRGMQREVAEAKKREMEAWKQRPVGSGAPGRSM